MFDKREPERTELTPELAALEQQLSALTITPPQIDRDKLMFEAGRAAARPERPGYIADPFWVGRYRWPAATAVMTAATLLLATMLVWQRQAVFVAEQAAKPPLGRVFDPEAQTRRELEAQRQAAAADVVGHPRDTAAQPDVRLAIATDSWATKHPPTAGYLGVRYIALTRGVGALEPSVSVTTAGRDSANGTPRTQRDMLNELLPSSQRAINPRS